MIKIYYNQLIDMVHAIHNFLGETPTKGDVCKLINGCRQERWKELVYKKCKNLYLSPKLSTHYIGIVQMIVWHYFLTHETIIIELKKGLFCSLYKCQSNKSIELIIEQHFNFIK